VKEVKFWLDYLGGVDVLWTILTVLAATQVWKLLLKALRRFQPDYVRPMPYVFGAFAGWSFIDFSARGAMVGMSCGMLASFSWFAVAARLEYGSWQAAWPYISKRMQGK